MHKFLTQENLTVYFVKRRAKKEVRNGHLSFGQNKHILIFLVVNGAQLQTVYEQTTSYRKF